MKGKQLQLCETPMLKASRQVLVPGTVVDMEVMIRALHQSHMAESQIVERILDLGLAEDKYQVQRRVRKILAGRSQ